MVDGTMMVGERTLVVNATDSGRMVALRRGDRLAFDAPAQPGISWRLRGGAPVLSPVPPRAGEPAIVLSAAQAGRVGVDLVANGSPATLPRPIRLIVCVND